MTLTKNLNIKQQKGIGLFTLLFFILVVLYFSAVVIKTGPVYLDNMSVKQSLQDLANSDTQKLLSAMDVRENLQKRFEINDVKYAALQDISVVKSSLWYDVSVQYETRIPFIFNVSILLSFDDKVEVPIR